MIAQKLGFCRILKKMCFLKNKIIARFTVFENYESN